MKSLILPCVLMGLAFAQSGGSFPLTEAERSVRLITKMDHDLALTETQESQLKPVLSAFFFSMDSLMIGRRTFPPKQSVITIESRRDTMIRKILTLTQWDSYQKRAMFYFRPPRPAYQNDRRNGFGDRPKSSKSRSRKHN